MSDQASSNAPGANPVDFKGKGKAEHPPQDMSMDEDDESSEGEGEVSHLNPVLRPFELTHSQEEVGGKNGISCFLYLCGLD